MGLVGQRGLVGRLICGEGHLAVQSISISVVAVGRWVAYPLGLRPLPLLERVLVRAAGGKRTGYGRIAACTACAPTDDARIRLGGTPCTI